jgi:hypothetical protein
MALFFLFTRSPAIFFGLKNSKTWQYCDKRIWLPPTVCNVKLAGSQALYKHYLNNVKCPDNGVRLDSLSSA